MHLRTVATLRELQAVEWFSRCGLHDVQSAIILNSWKEAIEHCSTVEWENACLEMANKLSRAVMKVSPDRFRLWNDVAGEIRPVVIDLVREKTAKVVSEHQLPKVFIDTVVWDIIHLALEAEYADIVPVSFYAGQSFWYANGHFPCGWDADKKMIIIY